MSGERFAAAVERAAQAAEIVERAPEDDDGDPVRGADRRRLPRAGRQRVEVAVIEAGLGGRYDATNVIPSKVRC